MLREATERVVESCGGAPESRGGGNQLDPAGRAVACAAIGRIDWSTVNEVPETSARVAGMWPLEDGYLGL